MDNKTSQLAQMQAALERVRSGKMTTEEAMTDLIVLYKEAGGAIKNSPYKTIQAEAKEMVQEIIIETGKTTWKTELGSAYIPAPGKPTVKYDAKAIDALCASSPELAELLAPHRKETSRAGSLTIR